MGGDDAVHVDDLETALAHKASHLGEQLERVSILVGRVGVGEELPDVAPADAAEQGVGNGVREHVGIRVPQEPARMRYVHAAQDEPAPLGERMHIVALPDAQTRKRVVGAGHDRNLQIDTRNRLLT